MEQLLPCPFCNVKPYIYVCDDEGNVHDWEYEDAPWSGLSYGINHYYEDVEAHGAECPIASYDEEPLGNYLYESIDDLVSAWNTRLGVN